MIPAISGHSGPNFETGFWAGIQERKGNQPIKGSIGVFWHVYRDLKTLDPIKDLKTLESKDLKPDPTEGLKKVLREAYSVGPAAAKGLAEFYKFAIENQPLFFIKQGTKCKWLVRKTGSYYYEEKTGNPLWYPHRISFEFVRAATEEEGKARLGIGMNTMIWVQEPKMVSTIIIEMPPKKKTVATTNVVVLEPVKEKPKRTRKKPEQKSEPTHVPIPVITTPVVTSSLVEAIQEPLPVEETVIVKISVFEHDGKSYFRDPVKNKLYTYKSSREVGTYLGRWCPHSLLVITDVPDSDMED